ncbi:MAG: COX15/CtaA family protein [Acidimicrobiia bacterium]|nr:COX15/CtaA family protein [Acidimicrobiia bacterium]
MAAPRRLVAAAWTTLGFTVLVILLGAVVRATGSGAGCGANWPTCNGGLLPLSGTAEEAIEFTHRATSGRALVAVAGLYLWIRRVRPAGDLARRAAFFGLVFILVEAAIGAGLVLFEWVAEDTSVSRAITVGIHLVNTFLLVAALALTAWWLQGGSVPPERPDPRTRRALGIGAGLLLLVGAMGAVTALGDTLFPADSLIDGIRDDFSAAESFLVRLRWIHPILAVGTAWYLLHLARSRRMTASTPARTLGTALTVLVVVQIGAGVVNVLLLAPLWMQVVHLLLADTLWIVFVLFGVEALAASRTVERAKAPA